MRKKMKWMEREAQRAGEKCKGGKGHCREGHFTRVGNGAVDYGRNVLDVYMID